MSNKQNSYSSLLPLHDKITDLERLSWDNYFILIGAFLKLELLADAT